MTHTHYAIFTEVIKWIRPGARPVERDGLAKRLAQRKFLSTGLSPRRLRKRSMRRVPVVDSRGVPLMPCHPAKARVIAHLSTILPLSDVVMEDVQAVTRKGRKGKRPPIPTSPKGAPVSSRRLKADGSLQADKR